MHSSDQRVREEAITIMEKYHAIEYVKQFARKMVEESWKEAERLLPASDGKEKLKTFAQFLIERNV
jgi:geranylgeranyl pyrophosphate synthase